MTGRQSQQKRALRARGWDQRWRVAAVCCVLTAITFAVFGQTLRHEFIDFDDQAYVYANPVIVQGLTLKGIVWAFACHAANWHPLTWLSHMLDCQLYGLNPGGHHFTNVLFHIATVIALFLVLRLMTGALWRSAFVAAVFAIHPLRVESVAWVAERKDVLSGLFFILTIAAYVRYARGPSSPARYVLVMLLFALGLMCKPMLVTLPVVLLLLDYWPLQRVGTRKFSGLVMEKLPLLALSAAGCVATLVAQHKGIQSSGSFALQYRLSNALVSCMVYLGQMVWPRGLAVFYPYPRNGLPGWEVALAGMLMAGLSAIAWVRRRKQPWILVGWLWYLVMLLPVVGIIQVGDQAHADRYTYLPQIGICLAATWLMAEWQAGQAALASLMAGVIAALMVCAWKQTAYWKDSEILWTHTLACTTDNSVAHVNLGIVLRQKGEADEAVAHYKEALQINPGSADAHVNLGITLLQRGKLGEAMAHFQKALQIKPADADIKNNLAWLLAACPEASLRNGNQAVELARQLNALTSGENPVVLNTLAAAYAEAGRFSEAVETAQRALRQAEAQSNTNLARQLQSELKLYQAGRPFHLPAQTH